MKKFIVIIAILLIIFIGMLFNRNLAIKVNNISVEEIEKIENYISKIYLEKEAGTLFLLNNIERTEKGYKAEIVEYVVDYSLMLKDEPENTIIIRNLEGEEISRYSSSNEEDETIIVKRNIDKFSKKSMEINKEEIENEQVENEQTDVEEK